MVLEMKHDLSGRRHQYWNLGWRKINGSKAGTLRKAKSQEGREQSGLLCWSHQHPQHSFPQSSTLAQKVCGGGEIMVVTVEPPSFTLLLPQGSQKHMSFWFLRSFLTIFASVVVSSADISTFATLKSWFTKN